MDKEEKDKKLPELEDLLGPAISKLEVFKPKATVDPLSLTGSIYGVVQDASTHALTSFSALNTKIDEICGRNKPINVWESLDKFKELTSPAIWALGSVASNSIVPTVSKDLLTPKISALASLEEQTSLIARDLGIPKITSVASQISTISGILSSETDPIRE